MRWSLMFLTIFAHFNACFAQTFNVKNYGAKGDGKTNDTKAILRCFEDAQKSKDAEIFFPQGEYLTSQQLDFFIPQGRVKIFGESKGKSKIRNIANTTILSIRGYYQSPAKGNVIVRDLSLFGSFPVYSQSNKFINKSVSYYGIGISDVESVEVSNVQIQNIYGIGLSIFTTAIDINQSANKIKSINIINNEILNAWGYNPKKDDYGDGIYIANVAQGKISNNKILNDFNKTKQLGRAGIVIEYLSKNITLSSNTIFGYDRGMHFELDLGNHIIEKNRISGTDLGMVFYNVSKTTNAPVTIRGNFISNNGFPKNTGLKRTRGVDQLNDRSLVNFYAPHGERRGSIIEDNIFEVDDIYDYKSSSLMNIISPGMKFVNNSFLTKNLKKQYSINFDGEVILKENKFQGVNDVKLRRNGKVGDVSRENSLNGAKLSIN